MSFISSVIEFGNAITFPVRVVPRASKGQIVGVHDDALKIRLASAPVDGAANAELIRLLAKHFAVPRGDVAIISGETSRSKRIRIENLPRSEFEEKLL